MVKTVNLTVRLEADLKRSAESAALALDVSLSQVVRKAFRALVQQAALERGKAAVEAAAAERQENLRQRYAAQEGIEPGQVSRLEQASLEAQQDPRNLMTRQQRRAYERELKKGGK